MEEYQGRYVLSKISNFFDLKYNYHYRLSYRTATGTCRDYIEYSSNLHEIYMPYCDICRFRLADFMKSYRKSQKDKYILCLLITSSFNIRDISILIIRIYHSIYGLCLEM